MSQYTVNSFSWQGNWNNFTSYVLYDVVDRNGSMYLCTTANSNTDPATDGGAHWTLMVSKGDTGSIATVTVPFLQYAAPYGTNNTNLGPFGSGANSITIVPFTMPYPQQFSNILVDVTVADSTHNCDIGIYDTTGTLVCHWGPATTSSTGAVTFSVGTTTISAGTYFLALTSSNNHFSIQCGQVTGFVYYTTTTTSSGGVLPSTITLSTSFSWNGTLNLPQMLLV